MAMVIRGVKRYERNEKRPWSEFQPSMLVALLALHVLAIGAIVWHAWGGFWPSPTVVATAIVMYIFTLLGVTMGYHRLFTHRGYACKQWLKVLLLIAGGMALQKDADDWVRTHWFHHSHSDQPGDPHSPYQYRGSLWLNLKGILWSHMGWLLYRYDLPMRTKPDQMDREWAFQFQRRHYPVLVVTSLALPAVIGGVAGLVSEGWHGALVQAIDGFLVAGIMRALLMLHVTWCINSVCHLWGERLTIRVTKRDSDGTVIARIVYPSDGSRNAFGLKWLSAGEAYHALHHLFQRVAYHGWGKRAVDPTKWVLMALEKFGLIWDVQKPPEFEIVKPMAVQLPDESLIHHSDLREALTTAV